jgi:hypothetical protein
VFRIPLSILICAVLVGCGGSKEPTSAEEEIYEEGCGGGEEETSTDGGSYSPDKGTATIKGVVKWEGTPPKRRPVDMGAEKYCVEHGTVLSETTIVGADGGLANAFVMVTKGLKGWKFPKGTGKATLDQKGCLYVPHVLGMQLGQGLMIRNSDPIMHNIHAFDLRTGRDIFNFAQTQQGSEQKKKITKPGILHVKCDVHGWMGSYVHVVKHPFFAVTGEDGAFTLSKLPPGEYTIQAWHEKKYKTRTQTVTVGDGETAEISFAFSK